MYSKAKSCVQWDDNISGLFSCMTGVRQGENLSPLLFAIFLNDMKDYFCEKGKGLTTLKESASEIGLDEQITNTLYTMFIMLYADDTVVFAETPDALQEAINNLKKYCLTFDMKVNAAKTKVVVFSKGKVRNLPIFFYDGKQIEIAYDFQYLGIKLNYNNSFKKAQENLKDRASRAMYSLLQKSRKLMLPVEIQLELFDKIIAPILLYGAEIWCPQISDYAQKLQLKYIKLVLNLRTSTPTNMVLGETGMYPIEIQAKCRMLCFWYKLVDNQNFKKYSSIIYTFLFSLYEKQIHTSTFLTSVKDTLNNIGLSGIWLQQFEGLPSLSYFKGEIKRRLRDQYVQTWSTNIMSNELYYNYRLYKNIFCLETYFHKLPENLVKTVVKFRTLNHRLPIQTGRYEGIERSQRICTKCDLNDLGDEFHYLLLCPYFVKKRQHYLKPYFYTKPNVLKLEKLLMSSKKSILTKLAMFMLAITKEM